MYEYLKGKIAQKAVTGLTLEVGSVGYAVQIPLSTFECLPPLGEQVKILIHFVVREDAQILYGFATEKERHLFRMLISVSGIGPKVALTVLSGIRIDELQQAIAQGQVSVLQGIPGIGKKTAERLIVELREKLVVEGQSAGSFPSATDDKMKVLMEDSVEALISLGYRKQNARTAVEKVVKEKGNNSLTIEKLIRASLNHV